MAGRLVGQVALVTGASAGIGAAVARGLVAEGAQVALAARGTEALERFAARLQADCQGAGGRVLALAADVADLAQAGDLVERTVKELGGLDILVNNAGANLRGPIERYDAAALAHMVQVNLTAPIVLTRLALPHMRRRGSGAIVNVASLAGRVPVGHEAVYSATKFALRVFTLALEDELRGSAIRASVVSPGPVDTGFIMGRIDEVPDLVFAQPMSTAEQIAAQVLACIADGRPERMRPALSGYLATLGYVFPALRRLVVPLMERKGRREKERYRKRSTQS